VSVDGAAARRAAVRVREGAAIVVTLPVDAKLRERPQPEPVPLDIVYEDEHLIAINKPPGVVVHPSFRNSSRTVLNGVLWHVRDRRPPVTPGLVSRLDKDTSGLLLVAISSGAHARIQRDAAGGLVRKTYLAVASGRVQPASGAITLALRHDPADRRRMIAAADGAPSETRYRVLEVRDGVSLVACELVTGRTHQIRVHLAASGWPIVGDRLYGVAHPAIARQALHAASMTLPHPATGALLRLDAPLPPDIARLFPPQP
jgi:23S rRNA pseudouridine1911/1915/1917 synthase